MIFAFSVPILHANICRPRIEQSAIITDYIVSLENRIPRVQGEQNENKEHISRGGNHIINIP